MYVSNVKKIKNHLQGLNDYWEEPLKNMDNDFDIVLEWWKGNKKLTVWLEPFATYYIASQEGKFTDGDVNKLEDLNAIWFWLTEG